MFDGANDSTSLLGDLHYKGTKQVGVGTDYAYDGNGNLTQDNNKSISSFSYNHLNLPSVIQEGGRAVSSIGMMRPAIKRKSR